MSPAEAIPILHGLDADAIRRSRRAGTFFWSDLTIPSEATIDQIAAAYELEADAAGPLGSFGREEVAPRAFARRTHFDEDHAVFPFWCVRRPDAPLGESVDILEVNVLVHGDYLLTVHDQPFDLAALVGTTIPAGRSERHVVYVVLDAMTSSFFQALLYVQYEMEALEADLFQDDDAPEGGRRPAPRARIRDVRVRLTELRTVVGPQRLLFARVSQEIEHVRGLEGDDREHFEYIGDHLERIIAAIDAASEQLSSDVNVQLNDTIYRLTIIATIFLPLTFLTGFFGMNFGWMVAAVDSRADFLVFGVGGIFLAVALITGFLVSQGVLAERTWRPRPRRRS